MVIGEIDHYGWILVIIILFITLTILLIDLGIIGIGI
jgi:hypothetical protein